MTDVSVQGNRNWLSIKKAAEFFGTTPHTLRSNISKFKDNIESHVRGGGKQGINMYISEEGLMILRNIVGSNSRNLKFDLLDVGKEMVVKQAIEHQKQSSDPILSMLQATAAIREQQLQQNERLDALEEWRDATQLLEPPEKLTSAQREFLNERVRAFAVSTEIPYGYVWKKIHGHVGRLSLEHYQFEDYKVAIRYLKQMYEESRLSW